MTRKSRAEKITEALAREYPDSLCTLDAVKPYELLVSVRLAAQCTDARVNIVTKELFAVYPTLESFAGADAGDVEKIVRPCGFFRTKARDIIAMAKMLCEDFGGVVPDNMEELLKLPGVGRKTANLILGDVYGKPAVVCDTHCIRITNLLGLSTSKNPDIVERELREVLDPAQSNNFCHRMVLHGRAVCTARNPRCGDCCIRRLCAAAQD
ncbi:MAG: endonuclease III [Oscillospiraceae bacterium]|nr:endonuclease III [Oscillospiraceae bacterium]